MKLCSCAFILFSLLIFVSCKKNVTPVKGDWKWIYSTMGGFAGGTIKPSGNTVVSLSLDSSLNYTVFLNNQINMQGMFNITNPAGNEVITFNKPISIYRLFISKQETVYRSNDTLVLYDPTIEAAPSSVFIKTK